MGLFDMFKKKDAVKKESAKAPAVDRKTIFDTDYPLDKSDWKQVFSACLGPAMVIQNACAELVVKNRNWNVDLGKGILAFDNDTYPVQFIGSEASQSDSWMWGWNNINGFDDKILTFVREVHAIGEAWSLEPLTTKSFAMTDELYGHTLAMVACGITKGKYCYYRGPHAGGAIMMAFSGIADTVFNPVDMQNFISTTMNCIQQFEVNHKIFVESFLIWNGTSYEWNGDKLIAHFVQDLEISFERAGDVLRISGIKSL